MKVTSPKFQNYNAIPRDYTADGKNVSPPLHIEQLPAGTKELAIIVEDPDAPRPQPFVHWLAYKIPPAGDLPEDIAKQRQVDDPPGAMQGENDKHEIGYFGPSPPPGHGQHHYHFHVYALDKPLEVQPALNRKSLTASMSGHILDSAEVVGLYERPA